MEAIKRAMTRKVYRMLNSVAFIVKAWGLKDDFVSHFIRKLNQ